MHKAAKPIIILFLAFAATQAYSQPREVTPEMAIKINAQVEMSAKILKAKLQKDKDQAKSIDFVLDTFRIEEYQRRYLEYDYSTAGMVDAARQAAEKYDALLNKYYKMLLGKLDKEDKDALIQAQRAWITFRDKEMELESTLGKEKYSGGGTIQSIIRASAYETIIKSRAIELYGYYEGIGGF